MREFEDEEEVGNRSRERSRKLQRVAVEEEGQRLLESRRRS